MAYDEITALLGGWEGFELTGCSASRPSEGEPSRGSCWSCSPVPNYPKRCSRCGEVVAEIHDVSERRVRDLPILEAETWLVFPRARLQCPRCGPTVEAVPWLDRYQRLTTRLAAAIARLAQVLPVKHVAAWFGVGWETVKQIDRRALGRAARAGRPRAAVRVHRDRRVRDPARPPLRDRRRRGADAGGCCGSARGRGREDRARVLHAARARRCARGSRRW